MHFSAQETTNFLEYSLLTLDYLEYTSFYRRYINGFLLVEEPPLWSSGQSSWLLTQRSWVRFPVRSALVRINEELLEREVEVAV
jgi:hypothetical protein